jgi:hypothetical protein
MPPLLLRKPPGPKLSDPEDTTGSGRAFLNVGEPERRVSAEDIREMKWDIRRLEKLPERIAAMQASVDGMGHHVQALVTRLDATNTAVGVLQREVAKEQAVAGWVNKLVFLAVVALAGAGWYTAVSVSGSHSEMYAPQQSSGAVHR